MGGSTFRVGDADMFGGVFGVWREAGVGRVLGGVVGFVCEWGRA